MQTLQLVLLLAALALLGYNLFVAIDNMRAYRNNKSSRGYRTATRTLISNVTLLLLAGATIWLRERQGSASATSGDQGGTS